MNTFILHLLHAVSPCVTSASRCDLHLFSALIAPPVAAAQMWEDRPTVKEGGERLCPEHRGLITTLRLLRTKVSKFMHANRKPQGTCQRTQTHVISNATSTDWFPKCSCDSITASVMKRWNIWQTAVDVFGLQWHLERWQYLPNSPRGHK